MSQPIVAISGKKGPFQNVKDAMLLLDLTRIKGKSVLIKPNMGRSAKPGQGYNVHPEAVAGVIEVLQEAGASEVVIGESPLVGIDVMEAYKTGGVTEVAEKYGVKLIAFNSVKPIKKVIPNARVVEETKVCSQIYEYDILLSLPVAKTHMHTGVTLGLKNMKGCLYRHEKVRYHQLEYKDKTYPEKTLDSAISDLLTIVRPDITVLDGYKGMEGLGPSGGHMVKSDFAIASWDVMGADVYGCLMMGVEPQQIDHLRLTAERVGLSLNPEDYAIVPEHFEDFLYPYQKPPEEISVEYKNVVVKDNDSCSACLSTLMLFLRRFKNDMSPYLLDDGNFHIAIGKDVSDDVKEGTVFVGSCTSKHKGKGTYVPGCPPVPSRIYEAICGKEPTENEPEVE